ncbi:ATP synthase G chain, mitochondrial, partial [Nadsonia fulvescens var. elongata DSM 6958]
LVSRLVFYTRAAKEVGKEVYIQEGLAPPTLAQIKAAFNQIPAVIFKVAENPQSVSTFLSKLNSTELVKYTFYGVQLVGFFSLGEIIGRRNIAGYENPKAY